MSEEERAAKAARAKALLAKKRQQKKASEAAPAQSESVAASPRIPARTFSPAPEPTSDLADVFSTSTSDASWVSSLPQAASTSPSLPSPAPTSTVSPAVSKNTPLGEGAAHKPPITPAGTISPFQASEVAALRSRIESLTDENTALTSEIEQLKKARDEAADRTQALLDAQRRHVEELQSHLEKQRQDTEIALDSERQTVALLVNEKSHLTAELEKCQDFESKAQVSQELLEAERQKNEELGSESRRLKSEAQASLDRVKELAAREKELIERTKDQERQLQRVSAEAAEGKKSAEEFKRKHRELEEQIQADDRVDRLEASLKNTQDRADDLEFQLSKLKTTYNTLKTEKDTLQTTHQNLATKEGEWSTKLSKIEEQLKENGEHLSKALSEKDVLAQDKESLLRRAESAELQLSELQEKLLQAATVISTHARQLQGLQGEVKAANRRADEAEKAQKSLQAEGSDLMRSVNEMRPKIVELTSAKLELSERVHSLEHTISQRDSTIAQLETELDSARDVGEQSEKALQDRVAQHQKQAKEARQNLDDLQKAYNELQAELEGALASLRNIETQRTNQHQDASRRIEEQERLTAALHAQDGELKALREELDAQSKAQEELEAFLDQSQNEVEGLRSDLQIRDNEIQVLRETINSSSQPDGSGSLDGEMLSSLRQQHALDLSAASSQIRALENTIFEKDSVIHSLQKQVGSLEEQITQLRSTARPSRPFSPNHSARPASRGAEGDLRRASFASSRHTPLARSMFDTSLTPEQIHKRKVSLSMLKARIESEMVPSEPPSRALSPVQSESHSRPASVAHFHNQHRRPQFLDESHVFWCHSCEGDLVIL